MDGATRAVDGDLAEIHAEAVALRVGVIEQTRLQHFVGAGAYAGNQVARCEGGLLHIGEEVFGIAVQLEFAYFNQRIVLFRPNFSQIKRMIRHFFSIGFRHNLDVHRPFRKLAAFDGFVQVALVAFAVIPDDFGGFFVGQVFNALLGAEVEFHPKTLARFVPEAVGMRTEAVHMAVAGGDAAVAHDDGNLVQGFGQQRPEVPVVFCGAHIGARVAFDCLVQVREFARVAHEKDGRVITDHIPVAFFRIKLQCKAADVAFGIGTAALCRNGGEAGEHFGFFADFAEDFGAGVFRDVVRYGKRAERARTFGVHTAFGNDFAHEVAKFFIQPQILRQQRAARTCSQAVLIVGNGGAVAHGQVGYRAFGVSHDDFLYEMVSGL